MKPLTVWAHRAAIVLVLLYVAVAACRALDAFDLGWQLATGRFIWQTHTVPREDVLSYTAAGREWIYPAGAQLLFYALFKACGYAALNWLGMVAAVAATVGLLFTGRTRAVPWPSLPQLFLAVLAVPSIAARSSVRADMFTTVLFAWTAALLANRRLSALPFVFLAWANLHQGFIFGLLLFAVFICGSIAERNWTDARRLLKFLALSAAAILVNPFGWRIYTSLFTVARDMAFQRGLVAEASPVPLGFWRVEEFRRLHDPASAFWILMLLGVVAVLAAAFRRQVVPLLLASLALYLGVRYARAQALSAILLAASIPMAVVLPAGVAIHMRRALVGAASALLLTFIAFHSHSFASNRYFIARGEITTFGFGLSWWFPERAFDFLLREDLPGRIYNDYNLGGWAAWRLVPRYAVYVDGRAAPFTPGVLLEQQRMLATPPDSAEWREWLDHRGINTLLISLARYGGYRISPALLCSSQAFRLVYLDEVSGVWIRNSPGNQAWLDRLGRPCPGEPFPVPDGTRAQRYNFLANAGQLYQSLGNDALALEAYTQAEKLFGDDASLRLNVATIWQRNGRVEEARREYLNSLRGRPTASAWHALAMLEYEQARYEIAADAFLRAARRSVLPHESHRMRGESLLALRRPQEALAAFDDAERSSRYRDPQSPAAITFSAALNDGRARARAALGQP